MVNNFIIVLLLSFGFGQLSRLSFIYSQLNIYLSDILMLAVVIYSLIKYKQRVFTYSLKFFKTFGFLLVLLPLSLLPNIWSYTVQENFVAVAYAVRLMLYITFFYSLLLLIHSKEITKDFLRTGLYYLATIVVLGSILQYVFFPDLLPFTSLGWDQHYLRMVGTYLDSAVAAGVYGFFIVFFLFEKRYWAVAAFITLLLLSYSRISYIALSVVLIIYVFKRLRPQAFIAAILATVVAVVLLFSIIPKPFGEGGNLLRTSTIESRVDDYKRGMQLWLESPLVGIGYNRIRYVQEEKVKQNEELFLDMKKIESSHAGASFHSSYILVLVTTGVIGLVVFSRAFFELSKTSERVRYLLLYVGVMSVADNLLLHAFILPLLFIVSAHDQSSLS